MAYQTKSRRKANDRVESRSLVPTEVIAHRILLIRGQKVMLDRDLAGLYGVTTGNLNKAVARNLDRFPADFMFRLSSEEDDRLIFQSGISNVRRGGSRYPPFAFTEQGVAMLSSVLRSERAILVNVSIMRAFVKLREILSANKDLARKLEAMEDKYDEQFRTVFQAIRQLMEPTRKSRRKIGFKA